MLPSDRYLASAPLAHVAAASRMLTVVHAGATHVIERRFDPERVLAEVTAGRANSTFAVPEMVREMLTVVRTGAVPGDALRLISYGGSPMSADLLNDAIALLACDFQQGYGLTEASPILTILPPEDHGPNVDPVRLTSVGREAAGVQVRVVGNDDRLVKPGEVGEVVARGPNVTAGYWRRPKDTAAALRGGWLRTGDLARMDSNGYLYLVDRAKDMLVSGGLNVYPREIERQLEEHPGIREAAVVGVADERWGEVPVAFLVLAEGKSADPGSELDEFLAGRLARYKQPKRYEFLDLMPRNGAGKVLKRELRERAAHSLTRPEDLQSS